jgi:4-amino-4-deoxy-L-arabinose transferase-like glycosyltransferase
VRRLLPLGLLILIGFGLRVHQLGAQELRGDEGFTWNYIQRPPLEILATIIREGDPQPPLHYWLQWAWLQGTGDSEFAMRAWSALLSLLLVPLCFHLGRRFWRPQAGLFAAGFAAFHPQQIWLAQDVRNMYQLALVFLLIGMLQLPRRTCDTGSSLSWSRRNWFVYVLCGVLAMYSHYYAVFVLIGHGAWFFTAALLQPAGRKAFWHWLGAGIVIAAAIVPWAIVILPVYAHGQLADPGRLSLGQYFVSASGDLLVGATQSETLKLVSLLILPFMIIVAWWAIRSDSILRPQPAVGRLISAGFVVPFAGIYAVTATRSTFNTFYLSFAFPALCLLGSGVAAYMWRKTPPVGAIAVVSVGLVYALGIFNQFGDPAYSKTRGFREIAVYLTLHAQSGDIYLANAPDPAQVYYLRNVPVDYRMQPGRIGMSPAHIAADIQPLLSHRVWFAPANTALDPQQYVAAYLDRVALLAEDVVHHRATLKLYLPLGQAHPLDAEFAGGIRLIGYYFTPDRLSLVWQADTVQTADYTVFVHALAPDTFNLAGHDSPPQPRTSQWRPGTPILDVHAFSLPENRPLTLVAGMYLAPAGNRLKLLGESFGEADAARVITLAP